MILIVKVLHSTEEFEKIATKLSNITNNTSAIGRFFTHEQIENATKTGLFKELKTEIKDIENTGKEVYYFCTDSTCQGEEGKRLFFASDADGQIVLKLLGFLIEISEGRSTKLEECSAIPEGSFAFSISGTASNCPLF